MVCFELYWRILEQPRVELITLPTPMERLINLSKELNVDIYVKRDDVMELAMGGNKVRKLEFILGDALRKNCNVLITRGSYFSNHVRLTAAASRKLGLEVFIVTYPPYEGFVEDVQGNFLLNIIFGAKVIEVRNPKEADEEMVRLSEKLVNEGYRPYVIPVGGSTPQGVLGYALAVVEVMEQARALGFKPDYIVHATGTGTTQAGLILGLKLLGVEGVKVIGVDTEKEDESVLKDKIINLVEKTASMLKVDVSVSGDDVLINRDYSFGGYGRVSKELVELITWVARKEGLLLDPVYTGKAFYCLVDLIKRGEIREESRVVFIHTGGLPLVFQNQKWFIKHLH